MSITLPVAYTSMLCPSPRYAPLSAFFLNDVIEAAREQPLMRLLAPLIARTFYRVCFFIRGAHKKNESDMVIAVRIAFHMRSHYVINLACGVFFLSASV